MRQARLQLERKKTYTGKCQSQTKKRCEYVARWGAKTTCCDDRLMGLIWKRALLSQHDPFIQPSRTILYIIQKFCKQKLWYSAYVFLSSSLQYSIMLSIYTSIIAEEGKRDLLLLIFFLSFILYFFFLFFTLVNLFFIGCAVRFIVPPIVTILIIHSVRRQERWRSVEEEYGEKEKKRSIDSYLN
jgi:ABC-type multidrug transport system fused ATPase/permease subunit